MQVKRLVEETREFVITKLSLAQSSEKVLASEEIGAHMLMEYLNAGCIPPGTEHLCAVKEHPVVVLSVFSPIQWISCASLAHHRAT